MDIFLDYDKIKDSNDGDIVVKCYNNGIKWICPDPNNDKLSWRVENWYLSTHNIQYKEVKITNELFITSKYVQE